MQPRTYPAQRAGRGVERGPQRVRFRASAAGAVCLSCCTPPRHQCSEQLLQPCAQERRRKPGAKPALAFPTAVCFLPNACHKQPGHSMRRLHAYNHALKAWADSRHGQRTPCDPVLQSGARGRRAVPAAVRRNAEQQQGQDRLLDEPAQRGRRGQITARPARRHVAAA
jgi:hypothetical protein